MKKIIKLLLVLVLLLALVGCSKENVIDKEAKVIEIVDIEKISKDNSAFKALAVNAIAYRNYAQGAGYYALSKTKKTYYVYKVSFNEEEIYVKSTARKNVGDTVYFSDNMIINLEG